MLPKALLLVLLFVALTRSTIQYDPFWEDDDNDAADRDNTSTVAKRWYSIKVPPTTGRAQWDLSHRTPWPEVCPGKNWLRYCFTNQRSMDNLWAIFVRATPMWAAAIEQSTLDIQPDPACDGNRRCLCNAQSSRTGLRVAADTYRISDGVTIVDGRTVTDVGVSSTLGYKHHGDPGRHNMNFGNYDWNGEHNKLAYLRVEMAHELGESKRDALCSPR